MARMHQLFSFVLCLISFCKFILLFLIFQFMSPQVCLSSLTDVSPIFLLRHISKYSVYRDVPHLVTWHLIN